MLKIKKIISWIFSSSIMLYFIGFLVFSLAVDEKKIDLKILNYLRGSVRYINLFYEGSEKYDPLQFKEAIEYYERIKRIMPLQQLTLGALGYCYYYFGEKEKAIVSFEKAIEENPEFFGYRYNLALIYFKEEQWEKAAEAFKEATSVKLDTMTGYYTLVSRKVFKDKMMSDAFFKRMITKASEAFDDCFKMIVYSYDANKKYADAFSISLNMIKLGKDTDGFFRFFAGKAAFQLGQMEQAFRLFDECLKINNQYSQAYKYEGLILEKMGKEIASQVLLKKADETKEVEYNPKRELFYFIPIYELGGYNVRP